MMIMGYINKYSMVLIILLCIGALHWIRKRCQGIAQTLLTDLI